MMFRMEMEIYIGKTGLFIPSHTIQKFTSRLITANPNCNPAKQKKSPARIIDPVQDTEKSKKLFLT